jgi:hypothetical protein
MYYSTSLQSRVMKISLSSLAAAAIADDNSQWLVHSAQVSFDRPKKIAPGSTPKTPEQSTKHQQFLR